MFTGLIQAVGTVAARESLDGALAFEVRAPDFAGELDEGESVCIDGACQSVTGVHGDRLSFVSVATTLERTTFGEFEPGRKVNLERALRAGDRLGGHLVQGHVDGIGSVTSLQAFGETRRLGVRLPPEVAALTVPRGSIAVDGVSLTVAEITGEVAEIAIIPYTWTHTAFARLTVGERVNLEADVIGRYVQRLVDPYLSAGPGA